MLELAEGQVTKIISHRPALTKVELKIGAEKKQAINYNQLLGEIEVEDRVIVNTAATSLELGTGGYDFVVCILGKESTLEGQGHIMKLRYTPYQLQTCTWAEQESPDHKQALKVDSIDGTPVVVGTLHSMLPAIVAMIKAKESEAKIAYVMTDAAALPLALSELVYQLQKHDLIDLTITSGHSFGGDLEAVNIYSSLLGAHMHDMDIIVVTMGPGIVGTGTKYGFSGTEQADILNAVSNLDGQPIAVPRINFSDSRERHYGLSHHSKTNLGELVLVESTVGIPKFKGANKKMISRELAETEIVDKHQVVYRSGQETIKQLEKLKFKVTTMGQDCSEVPEYFMTAGVAGQIAAEKLGVISNGS
jgi:hypothetical protein